jgi:hypothetical protein
VSPNHGRRKTGIPVERLITLLSFQESGSDWWLDHRFGTVRSKRSLRIRSAMDGPRVLGVTSRIPAIRRLRAQGISATCLVIAYGRRNSCRRVARTSGTAGPYVSAEAQCSLASTDSCSLVGKERRSASRDLRRAARPPDTKAPERGVKSKPVHRTAPEFNRGCCG